MTHSDHDPDEADLRALFDGTADELDGPGLTKLRARAADIPARRRPYWWRVWAPAFAVALGAIVVFSVRAMNRPEGPALADLNATRPAPSVLETAPAPSATPADDQNDDDEELAFGDDEDPEALDFDDDGDDLLAFGEPSSDDDLDAWLEATDELLGEGG